MPSPESWARAARVEKARRHKERRERIATIVIAGLVSLPLDSITPEQAIKAYTHFAVRYADALIAELDKENEPC